VLGAYADARSCLSALPARSGALPSLGPDSGCPGL